MGTWKMTSQVFPFCKRNVLIKGRSFSKEAMENACWEKRCFAGHVQSRTNHVRNVSKGEIHFASLILVIGSHQVSRHVTKNYTAPPPPKKKRTT